MEPVSPLLGRQEFRLPVPAAPDGKDVTLYLAADDAGDGYEHDASSGNALAWSRRGCPTCCSATYRRSRGRWRPVACRSFAGTAKSLAAAAEAGAARGRFDPAELARKHDVPPDVLAAWFDYLGLGHRRRLGDDHVAPSRQESEGGRLRLRERLGPRRDAERGGQLVRHARPRTRQPEAAQRGDAPLADAARGRGLAQPGVGRRCGSRGRCSTRTPSAATA